MTWADLIIAGISALSGGGLLKVAEYWLNRAKSRADQAQAQRQENRLEVSSLNDRIRALKTEIQEHEKREDDWRLKYWDIHFKYNSFLIEVQTILLAHGINPKEVFLRDPNQDLRNTP